MKMGTPNLSSLILALFCEKPGECTNSILLAFTVAKSMQECMEICLTYDTCQYGTFRSDKKLCVLFQTCLTLQDNEFCPSCITSSPKCSQPAPKSKCNSLNHGWRKAFFLWV